MSVVGLRRPIDIRTCLRINDSRRIRGCLTIFAQTGVASAPTIWSRSRSVKIFVAQFGTVANADIHAYLKTLITDVGLPARHVGCAAT